jgi:hypothetical protein
MSFVIARDGDWFGKYPPGFPAVLSLGELVGRPWLVNALAASLAVGLVIAVGRRFYDLRSGLLAAGLLALSPFFILQSGSLLSHIVALCWTLVLLLLFDLARSRDAPWAALGAGVAAGMLLLTRPLTAVGVALPFVIVVLADLRGGRPLLQRYALMVAGCLPFALGLSAYNDATTGSPLRFAYELWWSYDRIGFGPEYGVNGHSLGDAWDNTRSNLDDLSKVLFGWPRRLSLAPLAIAVAATGWRIRRRGLSRPASADLLLAGMAVGLIGVHMLYWTPGKMYGPRYYFEIIGALSLLSARGLIWVWDAAGKALNRFGAAGKLLPLAAPAALALLTGYNLLVTLPDEADRYRGWNGVTDTDLERLEGADLDNALVFVPRPNWQAYAPLFLANSTDLDGDVIYAVDRGNDNNPVLMRDFPDRDYYRYAGGVLTPLPAPGAVGSRSADRQQAGLDVDLGPRWQRAAGDPDFEPR